MLTEDLDGVREPSILMTKDIDVKIRIDPDQK